MSNKHILIQPVVSKSQLLNENHVADSFNLDKKGDRLSKTRKLYEFYTAPITKFWLHTVCKPHIQLNFALQ